MNKRLLLPLLVLLATGLAHSQTGNTLTIRFAGAPSGSCAPFMLGINNATGAMYDCVASVWTLVGGGGGGSGTVTTTGSPATGQVAVMSGATSITSTGAFLFSAPTLTVSLAGSGNGALALSGNTSGTTTLTAPAVAGTSTNPLTISNVINVADGAGATVGYGFNGSPNWGMWRSPNEGDLFAVAGVTGLAVRGGGAGTFFASGGILGWISTTLDGTNQSGDTGVSRIAAGYVGVGTGAASSTAGFIKTAQTLAITTADVTCGTGGTISSCVAFQTVTGLSVALPLVAANWSFDCNLIVGQATAAAADQLGVQTATNGATNLAAAAVANTAAGTSTSGAITGVASTTTAQSVVTFTPGATGTKMPVHLWGTIEGASASGTTFNVTVLTGAAADLLTIYRGSTCQVY